MAPRALVRFSVVSVVTFVELLNTIAAFPANAPALLYWICVVEPPIVPAPLVAIT